MPEQAPALSDPRLGELDFELVKHDRVASLEEAAEARGLEPAQVIKTMVVRQAEDDYVFVLVPGDRVVDWPKLRSFLNVNRLSMPDADEALAVTGYARGTITPFAASHDWPVIADVALSSTCSIGGGAPGVSLTVDKKSLIGVLSATVADVTKPAG